MDTKENKKELSSDDIIEIISKHSLTVRCLPKEVVNYYIYHEVDENKEFSDPFRTLEIVIENFNLDHFKTTRYDFGNLTPEQRFNNFKRNFPSGRKLLKETRKVEKGGYWYVKEVLDTYSTVRFDRDYAFFAPTLVEAIMLFLETKE